MHVNYKAGSLAGAPVGWYASHNTELHRQFKAFARRTATLYRIQQRGMRLRKQPWRILTRPHFIFLVIVFAGPGVILLDRDNNPFGWTLLLIAVACDLLAEAFLKLRFMWLKRKAQRFMTYINKHFMALAMLNGDTAWVELDKVLVANNLSIVKVLDDPEFCNAADDDLGDYLADISYAREQLRLLPDEAVMPPGEALAAVTTQAKIYGAKIALEIGKIKRQRYQ